jgi:hypothetical protein
MRFLHSLVVVVNKTTRIPPLHHTFPPMGDNQYTLVITRQKDEWNSRRHYYTYLIKNERVSEEDVQALEAVQEDGEDVRYKGTHVKKFLKKNNECKNNMDVIDVIDFRPPMIITRLFKLDFDVLIR